MNERLEFFKRIRDIRLFVQFALKTVQAITLTGDAPYRQRIKQEGYTCKHETFAAIN